MISRFARLKNAQVDADWANVGEEGADEDEGEEEEEDRRVGGGGGGFLT